MPFELPPLPYDKAALAPYMSAETMDYHHGKHHKAYVDTLNKLTEGKPEANTPLERLILSSEGPVFNNAAQIWNHTFFWQSMKPRGGGKPTGDLARGIDGTFGSYQGFVKQFTEAAISQFGSGWAWLVLDHDKLAIRKTADADMPKKHGEQALLTIDVWEHAYYIDHRNRRPEYVQVFLDHLANWDFALENFNRRSTP